MGLAPGTLVTTFNPTAGSSSASSSAIQVRPLSSHPSIEILTCLCAPRSYQQVNNNSSRRIVCTVMQIVCCTEIVNPARMLSIGSWARSIKSAWIFHFPISCSIAPFYISFNYTTPIPSAFQLARQILTLKSHVYSIDKKGKFSRKRLNEDEGDITYINERNRVFNKKVRFPVLLFSRNRRFRTNADRSSFVQIARYYDKYTSEIRASFERGTAL